MVDCPDRPTALLQLQVGRTVRKTKNALWESSVQYGRLDYRVGLTIDQLTRLEAMQGAALYEFHPTASGDRDCECGYRLHHPFPAHVPLDPLPKTRIFQPLRVTFVAMVAGACFRGYAAAGVMVGSGFAKRLPFAGLR